MYLDALAVCIFHQHGQRVIRRRTATRSCQVLAPGLIGRVIHSVAEAANLKEHRVHVGYSQRIDYGAQFLLLFLTFAYIAPRLGPINSPHRGQP